VDDKLLKARRDAISSGDEQSAIKWFHETCRTKDYEQILESMKHLCEVQHPGLSKQLDEISKLVQPVQIAPPPWRVTLCNSGAVID
jgi:hypothetical protein